MCGIAGCTHADNLPPGVFTRFVDALAHRGPDARGEWVRDGVALGHRRLAIMDLSPRGVQPMSSRSGACTITFNGEIYNHRELRKKLPDFPWKSESDTETLVELHEAFGPGYLSDANGMFAIAIHDARDGKLRLWRDRLGVKPIYYTQDGGRFAFASELKALLTLPYINKSIDHDGLFEYFLYNYIPQPLTIFRSIRKMPPGTFMTVDPTDASLKIERWWSIDAAVARKDASKTSTPREAAQKLDELETLLLDSVRQRTLSDVPLGCFLSGGIDSSLVAWALTKVSTGTVRSFCIGFPFAEFDESKHAEAVAKHLGCDHKTLVATEEDMLELLPDLAELVDEPFADASILPTSLLARMTRQHVTVSLSGDGGDELFLGYDRYQWAEKVRNRAAWIPAGIRRPLAEMASALPSYRLQTIANGLKFKDRSEVYPYVFCGWNEPFVNALLRTRRDFSEERIHNLSNIVSNMTSMEIDGYTDTHHYMVDDCLAKVDKATMRHALEAREPMLDYRLAEFALQLPLDLKVRGGTQKWLLRKLLFKHVPKALFARPKSGFAVPLRHWFRGKLRPMLERELSPDALARHGLFNARVVRQLLDRHFSGKWNHERQLFALLVFQLWHRKYLS